MMLLANALREGFFGILLTFDTIIYGLISGAFKVFIAVAEARLLTSDAYYDIAGRVYMIVGVLMLFVLSYAILRAIIDPDQATKGELGPKMIQRVIIAVVGLALTPAIFNILYQAQGLFIEKDVLAKIFFKSNEDLKIPDMQGNTVTVDEQIKTIGGAVTANSIWQAFFAPANGFTADQIKTNAGEYFVEATLEWVGCAAGIATSAAIATGALVIPVIGWIAAPLIMGATVVTCIDAASKTSAANAVSQATGQKDVTLEEAYALTSGGGSFSIYVAFLKNFVDNKQITYLYLISTICGLFVLYSFISFTIDMGVRAAKLAYLQIVAPVPLVMQVLPKYKDTFTKWYKSVFSAFAEVFIRISVVYIVVYVICHLSDMFSAVSKGFADSDLNTLEAALAYAALIICLISFCRKAPNIIQQTLGISGGDLKFGLGEKLKDGGVFAATGIAAGGITSAVRGFRNFDRNKWKKEHGVDGVNGAAGAAMAQVMAGLGGLGAGMGRASWNQFGDIFGGKPKNEANNWHDAMEQGEKAAQQHMDAVGKAEARRTKHVNAIKNANNAREELAAARKEQALANARLEADPDNEALKTQARNAAARVDNAQKAYNEAQKEVRDTTAVGSWADTQRRKVRAWSTGSVDMSTEETALKLASDVKGLQDSLRAEALKKDENSKALNREYERLKDETVGDYRAGWDERSYNDELHRRLQSDAAYRDAVTDYDRTRQGHMAAQDTLDRARRENQAAQEAAAADPSNATLRTEAESKKRALEAAETAYEAAKSVMNTAQQTMLAEQEAVKKKLDAEAKLTEQEKDMLRAELQARVDAAKQLSEAAQDAWVQKKLAEGNDELSRIVEAAVTPYREFLQTHGSDQVVYDIDTSDPLHPVEKSMSISEMVGSLGDIATTGHVSKETIARSNTFELKDDTSGTVLETFTFDGTEYTDTSGRKYTPGQLSAHVSELMSSFRTKNPGHVPKYEAKTAANKAKDAGKKVGINTPRSASYTDKIQRKREAEGKK